MPALDVADLAGHHDRRGAQPRAQLTGQIRRRGLLDELLVATLRGAVAVAQVHVVAVAVGEHLDFDVARRGQVALDEQRTVAEGALGQAPRGRQRRRELRFAAHDAACPCRRRPRPA